ncbi:xanthine dehydrogenase family protein subunit M [Roseovarius spongiae]|uniref:Xanthine dehydrogenase family protein subunit M n=1 Tax=Roseovarius spongiae TaxID=2320272 RepID=A0A3A8AXZ0_9RHOB|nr:xanthine dehydrogenase family protein subunit M [Roseovarius spongiae]RKF16767.1 xanthine dehydrogenase family protein subunit M [Roseovarius spongiae]
MYETRYHKPATIDDAAALLSGNDEAMLLAGGQTLLPTMKQHLAAPGDLVDIRGIDGMAGIRAEGDTLVIGAATTHADVARSDAVRKHCPALAELAEGIGDAAVRNMGTIGGSLANNDPSACYPAALLALGGTVVTNTREITADDFFEGLFTTALDEGEIITAVRFPAVKKAAYAKFAQPASRFALVAVFVADGPGGVRVAVTGAGEDGVFRHEGLEAALSGDWSAAALDDVEISEDGLMSDFHGSADYRANLIRAMAKRAAEAASAR